MSDALHGFSRNGRLIITIDGPAGVGKSTAAKLLAKQLGLAYLDTGATYRAVAYAALQQGMDPNKETSQLAHLAEHLPIRFKRDASGTERIFLSGEDVTQAIRSLEVSMASARVSKHPRVRKALVALQRRLAAQQSIIAEGRDTGSVVFPKATHKFFLTAAMNVRTSRRQQEIIRLSKEKASKADIQRQLRFRDHVDLTRRVGPLIKPDGAVTIRTTDLSAQEVVRLMRSHIKASAVR